jgi:hypothetical protein
MVPSMPDILIGVAGQPHRDDVRAIVFDDHLARDDSAKAPLENLQTI